MVGVGGIGGLNPVDLSKMLSGKIAQASPIDLGLHAGRQRLEHAEGSRDRAAAQLPRLHRAEHDARRARARQAAPGRLAAESRSESARRVRREGGAGQHLESLQRRSAEARRRCRPSASTRCSRSTTRASRNAADFTYFFVGAFTEAEITPLLEKWVASLPSTGKKTSAARDMGIKFPAAVVKEEVKKGKEPASQTRAVVLRRSGL